MSICFSGAYTDSNLARKVYNYFETNCYPEIANYIVELYHCDLSDDNVKGWQEKNDEECDHEGYVISNDYGTFKLVDRDVFSKNNFLKVRD